MASNVLDLLSQLHDQHVEFVIVGGVAAALRGGSRVTFDVDVVPRLEQAPWEAADGFLWSLGARPRIPEPLERIRDIEHVRRWQRDEGMLALNFRSPDGSVDIDFLMSESDRFDDLRARAVPVRVGHRAFLVASIDDWIAMNERAGRPQDVLDVSLLQSIQRRLRNP